MAKKPKYPSIPMKDTVIDRLKNSSTPSKDVTDITSDSVSYREQNKKGTKYKSTTVFQNLGTTSDSSGTKAATFRNSKADYKESKLPKTKSSNYFLQMKEGEDSKLRIEKNKSGKDTRVRKISGERAERKFQRVLKRS